MSPILLGLCAVLVLGLLWGAVEIVGSIRRRLRYNRKVRIEGRVPSPARTLGHKFRLLFVPNVRKKTHIQKLFIDQLHGLLDQPVVVHASAPEPQALEDGKFHVLLQAGANPQAERVERPSSIFQVGCAGDTGACKTSGTGFPIVDPLTGFVVGELFDKRLYIHVDILAGGQQPQLSLLDAILRAASAEIESKRLVNARLTATESSPPVTVEGWEGREQELVGKLVRTTLAAAVGKPVVVRNLKGNNAFPVRNGNFNIFVHSAPAGKLSARPTNYYFSLSPLTQKLTFKTSEYGRPVTDTSQAVVGELVEDNLYIHLQAVEHATYTELAILAKIFERAVSELQAVGKRRAELLDQARKALPDLADKIDIYVDSPFVRPAISERFHIYVRALGRCTTRIPERWFELGEDNRSPKPFVPDDETQALWQHDCPVLEVVDGNRVFINADVWSTDKHARRAYPDALKVLASEVKAREYIEELFSSATLTSAQSFNFIDNGISGLRKRLIEGVARHIVLPRVGGQSVRMVNCKGDNFNPAYDGEFSIFLDSAPVGRKGSLAQGRRRVWSFTDSKLGAPVVEDDGYTTGELVDDNFFFHTEPLPRGTYTEAAEFAGTLLRVFEVRRQVESDRVKVEELAVELLGDRIEDPIVVYTGSRVVRKRVPGAFNIFFGEFANQDLPASSWWTPSPAGLMSLNWVGMPIVGTPIVNDRIEIIGELVGSDVFLRVGINPGGFEAKRERLVEVLKHLRADLDYRDYVKDVTEKVKEEDASLPAPLQVVRSSHYPNARAGALISGLCNDMLLARVGTDIEVTFGNRGQVEPRDDHKFHVIVAGGPEKEKIQAVPGSIFGHKFASSEDALIPSAAGQPIVDDETGFVVGELHARNLYIFEDIIRRATLKDAALVTRFLLEARKLLIEGADPEIVSRHFARDCADTFEKARSLAADPAALSEARQELRKMLIAAQKDELYYYQPDPGSDQLGEEFDQLVKIPKVTNVEVTSNALTVHTTTLYCTDPYSRLTYEIGAFKIRISLSDGNVNWKNLTRQVQGGSGYMNAPHVNSEGRACLGNTQGVFPDLIAKRELVSAVLLAIAFVESVNPGDAWGKYIVDWPRAYGR